MNRTPNQRDGVAAGWRVPAALAFMALFGCQSTGTTEAQR
jgi:hypothetical protein